MVVKNELWLTMFMWNFGDLVRTSSLMGTKEWSWYGRTLFLPSWLGLMSRIAVRLSLRLGRNWLGYIHSKKKSMHCPNNDSCCCVCICAKYVISRFSEVDLSTSMKAAWRTLTDPHFSHFFVWFPSVLSLSWMSVQQLTSGRWLGVSSANHVAPSKLERICSFSCDFSKQWCPFKETTISFK